jgi:hypothetical protein
VTCNLDKILNGPVDLANLTSLQQDSYDDMLRMLTKVLLLFNAISRYSTLLDAARRYLTLRDSTQRDSTDATQ